MEKIKARTKLETIALKSMKRNNKIMEALNSCFEKDSCDERDNETILRWACFGIPKEKLFFLFDKIKFEYLKI